MKVIFLDIDGVLNSMPYFQSKEYKKSHSVISAFHLGLLQQLHNTCNAKIVLCSTWREIPHNHPMYQGLENQLARYGMKIFSETPLLKDGSRPHEIKTWLTNHFSINGFVILDDDFSLDEYKKYGLDQNLVKTKYFCKTEKEGGLQSSHVKIAEKILCKKK